MSIGKIILENLLGYDMIIFIVALLNAVVLLLCWRRAAGLSARLNLSVYAPDPDAIKAAGERLSTLSESELISKRRQANALYAFFTNITSIFPLLGILGTVISLLPLVMDMQNMQQNFFAALTSTFWGLVFAILYKVLDGFIAPLMEENEKSVELYLRRDMNGHEE